MVQRAMGGPELSIDCLGDLDGRCLNAIPRTMLESRGGRVDQGRRSSATSELIELGARVRWRRSRCAARRRSRCSATPTSGSAITDVNTRFGGAFPAPVYAALPGRTYPELIVRMAAGETRRAARRRVPRGDDVHALLLAARARRAACARPAARSSPAGRPRRAEPHVRASPQRGLRNGCRRRARRWCKNQGVNLSCSPIRRAAPSPSPAVPAVTGSEDPRTGPAPAARAAPHRRLRRRARARRVPAPTAARRWTTARTGACSAAPAHPAASRRRPRLALGRDRARGHGRARAGRRRGRATRRSAQPGAATPAPEVTTVAQRPPPTTPATTADRRPPRQTHSGRPTTIKPLPSTTAKPPKIPLTASTPKIRATRPRSGDRHELGLDESATGTTKSGIKSSGGTTTAERRRRSCSTRTPRPPTTRTTTRRAGFGDPSLAIDGETSTAWTAQVESGRRAEDGRGAA